MPQECRFGNANPAGRYENGMFLPHRNRLLSLWCGMLLLQMVNPSEKPADLPRGAREHSHESAGLAWGIVPFRDSSTITINLLTFNCDLNHIQELRALLALCQQQEKFVGEKAGCRNHVVPTF